MYFWVLSFFVGLVTMFSLGAEERLPAIVESSAVPAPEFSVAGSFPEKGENAVRPVFNMNQGWRFYRGDFASDNKALKEAGKAIIPVESVGFDDSAWEEVTVPHGLEVLPEEASGCSNYRGVAYYRKKFALPEVLNRQKEGGADEGRILLYFEGIMGKSVFWVNGREVKRHEGGYLPIIIDVAPYLKGEGENLIVVQTDNSNDASYPPGKPQEALDFVYFGGIYRDVYLMGTGNTYITDANRVFANSVSGEKENRGGGIVFWTKNIDSRSGAATVGVRVSLRRDIDVPWQGSLDISLQGKGVVEKKSLPLVWKGAGNQCLETEMIIPQAPLWSPDNPQLCELSVELNQADNKFCIDKQILKVGMRQFSFSEEGLILNGKVFSEKLMGGNRHQDFAVLGNAVPNNLQWQDALKLRQAGMRVIRCAHYPMDPAFMDACDALGLFVIVTTPGWQFWGQGEFGNLVYDNITQMVRRDRNRPSVFLWEPILNETHYPADFAKRAYDIVHEEDPSPSCYAACDDISQGMEYYDVVYAHPVTGDFQNAMKERKHHKPYFCREYGDNVDSWSAHNSSSRVARDWGEMPMLMQAKHYMKPEYAYTSWDGEFKAPAYHFGAALWHSFDHQRGYHPDPFYGGIMDAFRQPKISYYGFMAQRPVSSPNPVGSGAMIYVAHSMTPFSPEEVTVFTNCEEVRLIAQGQEPVVKKVPREVGGMPSPAIVFENVWDFQRSKSLTRSGQGAQDKITAEGLIGGNVVVRHVVMPSRRPSRIVLTLDAAVPLEANGSDVAVVIASIVDENGIVKRLNNELVEFEVEGSASLIGGEKEALNPRAVSWGTAPVLVRMGNKAGKVTVRAKLCHEGAQKPLGGEISWETQDAKLPVLTCIKGSAAEKISHNQGAALVPEGESREELQRQVQQLQQELNIFRNKEVERDQSIFEGAK